MAGICYCESKVFSLFTPHSAIIENTVIGKVIFFGSLAFLSHHLGYADLSPAHLHALLTEILHIRNYIPPVPPLEPEIYHEVIQAADPKSP